MEENQFIEVMRKHSDEKLLEILNVKRKDYVADAITAAEEVLIERGVSFTKIQNEKFEEKIIDHLLKRYVPVVRKDCLDIS